MNRVKEIEYARALAALLVVMYHAEITMRLPKYYANDTLAFLQSANSGVQVFFVISGFVMHYVHHKDRQKSTEALITFAKKRIIRIYVPLWIVLLLITPVFLVGIFGSSPSAYDIFAAFIVIPVEKEVLLGVEWTLRHEMIFYILFAIYIYNRSIGTVILLLWSIGGSVLSLLHEGGWFFEFIFSTNHILFLFGILLSSLYLRRDLRMKFNAVVLIVGILIFCTTWNASLHGMISEGISNILYGLGVMFIFSCVLGRLSNFEIPLIGAIGSSSYAIYLIHYPLISFLCKMAGFYGYDVSFISRVIIMIIIVTTCVIFGYIFYIVVEQRAIKYVYKTVKLQR